MVLTVDEIKTRLKPVLEHAHAVRAYLFGSFSRGTATRKSDIDILIVKDTDRRFLDRFDEFDGVYTLLDDYAVDLLVYTPDEFESNKDNHFLKRVLTEGILVYES
jgi:predicted nucleotidyltransferase